MARPTGALLRGGELAGEVQNGATGLKNERILVREDLSATRNSPVHLEQGSQAWTGLAMARGGMRGGASPACGMQGPRGGLQLQDVALKVERN